MAEVAVSGAGYHLTVDVAELLRPVAEGNDLRGTHKGAKTYISGGAFREAGDVMTSEWKQQR